MVNSCQRTEEEKITSQRQTVDSQKHVRDVEDLIHWENAQLWKSLSKMEKIESTMHFNVSWRMFISWKAIKPLNLLSKTSNWKNYQLVKSKKDDHWQEWKASLQVNNILVFKFDTGARTNVIPSDVFNSLKGTPEDNQSKTNLASVDLRYLY